MRRPRNISLPTQIHELVVSTYFQNFINKETLVVLLYQAMVTLLTHLWICWLSPETSCTDTANLHQRHDPLPSPTAESWPAPRKRYARHAWCFFLTYHIRKAKKLADIFLTPVLKNLFPLKESATLSEWSLEWTISLSMVNTSWRPMAPRWARAWHLPMQICSWEILNSLPSKTPLWNHLSGGDISMTFLWSGLKEKIVLKPLLTT